MGRASPSVRAGGIERVDRKGWDRDGAGRGFGQPGRQRSPGIQGVLRSRITSSPSYPGWDSNARPLETFTNTRELQRRLKAAGVQLHEEADENTTGSAYFIAIDPDGNPILVDQHV